VQSRLGKGKFAIVPERDKYITLDQPLSHYYPFHHQFGDICLDHGFVRLGEILLLTARSLRASAPRPTSELGSAARTSLFCGPARVATLRWQRCRTLTELRASVRGVAISDPDGYTMFIGSSSLATSRLLYRSLPYAISDLAPVTFPLLILAPNSHRLMLLSDD
jgi:hypothetical protein